MHKIDCENRYFTKTLLIEANNAAIREGRNRQLRKEYLESLPDDKVYPIILSLDEHNRGEIRVQIMFDEKCTTGFLDLTKNRYNFLPKAILYENGTVELESEESINARRLYPVGREYVEKVGRKIIRNSNFRTKVLVAYGNQCAMCHEDDISILVAAHIYPAHLCSDDTVNNGICLCKIHDKLYEDGNICVRPNGEIFVQSGEFKLDCDKIRFPEKESNYPSSKRLAQRLELSLKRYNK
ncbi:HNH endonuclease [Bacillus mycoides]|uniref:HNH endonuclease n=1 Tax=Bacillus mycoides TaxID=1405 RepID=UPI0011EFDA05|nr:HNH endonuclease [Bacillus mycoides]QEL85910.1 HNH endonuclease [Bacillus mycoides]